MSLTLHVVAEPLLTQSLNALSGVLAKAAGHAEAKKIDPAVLLQARLYPDMLPLVRQVQIASDFAKGSVARLAGVELPAWADDETTFDQLQARITRTLDFIASVDAAKFDGAETREIVLRPGTDKEKRFDGQAYLVKYAIPQFLFHVTTAYAILRHNGVEIGKRDFMGA